MVNGQISNADLAAGTYVVTETLPAVDGYKLVSNNSDPADRTAVLIPGSSGTVTFNSVYEENRKHDFKVVIHTNVFWNNGSQNGMEDRTIEKVYAMAETDTLTFTLSRTNAGGNAAGIYVEKYPSHSDLTEKVNNAQGRWMTINNSTKQYPCDVTYSISNVTDNDEIEIFFK